MKLNQTLGYYLILSSICGCFFAFWANSSTMGIITLCILNIAGLSIGLRGVLRNIIQLKHLYPFLLLQVPAFKSQLATYIFSNGFCYYLFPSAMSEQGTSGAQLAFSFGEIFFSNNYTGWSIGINFVPILLLIVVLAAKRTGQFNTGNNSWAKNSMASS
ncbi:MAG TPA: hypothetical protein VLC98_04025 [Phnomibacter sp.]|nr:hypothetical protein [Phnomibacter sp.]